MKPPSPLEPPIPVGGATVGVGIAVAVAFGVGDAATAVGDGGAVTVGVGVAATAPQVRLWVFRPVLAGAVSAAKALSHLKLIVPPGRKQGG
jgi:hypothetical protein